VSEPRVQRSGVHAVDGDIALRLVISRRDIAERLARGAMSLTTLADIIVRVAVSPHAHKSAYVAVLFDARDPNLVSAERQALAARRAVKRAAPVAVALSAEDLQLVPVDVLPGASAMDKMRELVARALSGALEAAGYQRRLVLSPMRHVVDTTGMHDAEWFDGFTEADTCLVRLVNSPKLHDERTCVVFTRDNDILWLAVAAQPRQQIFVVRGADQPIINLTRLAIRLKHAASHLLRMMVVCKTDYGCPLPGAVQRVNEGLPTWYVELHASFVVLNMRALYYEALGAEDPARTLLSAVYSMLLYTGRRPDQQSRQQWRDVIGRYAGSLLPPPCTTMVCVANEGSCWTFARLQSADARRRLQVVVMTLRRRCVHVVDDVFYMVYNACME
jgi:CBS domain-containing protein